MLIIWYAVTVLNNAHIQWKVSKSKSFHFSKKLRQVEQFYDQLKLRPYELICRRSSQVP